MEVPKQLLEELAALLKPLIERDTRNDIGGEYLGEEFVEEAYRVYCRIEKVLDDHKLVVRKRVINNQEAWWVGRGKRKKFTIYKDEHHGGWEHGYCSRSKAHAERICAEIEERLASEEARRNV